jgi:hypothetical protein
MTKKRGISSVMQRYENKYILFAEVILNNLTNRYPTLKTREKMSAFDNILKPKNWGKYCF